MFHKMSIVTLMSYGGPEYSWSEWHQLSSYIHSMSIYGIACNVTSLRERVDMGEQVSHVDRRYIDGRPQAHGNIAGLINSSMGNRDLTNCIFEERTGREIDYMHRDVSHYIVVAACHSLRAGDELLIHYSYRRPVPARRRCLNLGQDANVPLGRPPRRL